jgi:hypothetical protein
MTDAYDYVQFSMARGQAARRDLLAHLQAAKPALADAGAEMLGLFTAQLGWEAADAALLVRWRGVRRAETALAGALAAPQVLTHTIQRLSPTVRPDGDAVPPPGGIYVHRWFETAAADLAEFLALSQEGWKDFEPRFEARVFGFFLADETEADGKAGSRRLLLLTRYGDHGVWEASRDPSTQAMQTFGRRALITRRTHAASTLLVPL